MPSPISDTGDIMVREGNVVHALLAWEYIWEGRQKSNKDKR